MLRYVGGAHGLDIDGVGVVIVIGSSIGDNARVAAPAASCARRRSQVPWSPEPDSVRRSDRRAPAGGGRLI